MTLSLLPRHGAAGTRLRALFLASCILVPGLASAEGAVSVASDAAVPHAGAALVGATSASKMITLAIALPSRDPAGAQAFATHVTTLGDPMYRQYLRPEQYAAQFGARPADYDSVLAWVKAQGLTPGEAFTARTVLPVTGTVAAIEAAFGVTISDYRDAKGRIFYAADRNPSLPAGIAGKVVGVLGLSSTASFVPLARIKPAGAAPRESGTGPHAAFLAADLRSAYAVPAQTFAPKTQTLAVFEQGGFDPKDVAVYLAKNKLPAVPVVVRDVDGYGGGIDDQGVELEAVLDIDMQIGINPAAKQILVYEDGADSFPVELLDSFSAMATDDMAKSISVSYGQDETVQGATAIQAENTVLLQLVAQGQAVFAACGDSGAYGSGNSPLPLNVADPASQPEVTAVGGTTLFTGAKQSYLAENAWNDLNIFEGATGGGVSTVWALPSYQESYGYPITTNNGGSATYRNVPDVAAVADPLTGVAIYSKLNGGWLTVGGTSVAAPIWAGLYSLANDTSEGLGFGTIGFANPPLYKIATSYNLVFAPDLHDVVDGTNGTASDYAGPGFSAGYGYDNTTGLGSFSGANLIDELALLPASTGTTPPAAPSDVRAEKTTSTSVTLKWKPVTGAAGYLVVGFGENKIGTLSSFVQKSTVRTYTGLLAKGFYDFSVAAISAGGLTFAPAVIVTLP
jgi:kumamolisin